jgi:hypothetical protein
MLKLEKIAKSLELSITLRERDRFFNHAFIKAFMIAIGLHLFTGLLFNVRLIKITGSRSVSLPALVDIDMSILTDKGVLAMVEEMENFPKHFVEAKISHPPLLSFPIEKGEKPLSSLNKNSDLKTNFFISLEQETYDQPALPLLWNRDQTDFKPIEVSVSGGLDSSLILEEGWEKIDLSMIKNHLTQTYRVVFAVRLDNYSGSLFWYDQRTEKANKELDALAENILKNMLFAETKSSFSTSGEVEIRFTKDDRENLEGIKK